MRTIFFHHHKMHNLLKSYWGQGCHHFSFSILRLLITLHVTSTFAKWRGGRWFIFSKKNSYFFLVDYSLLLFCVLCFVIAHLLPSFPFFQELKSSSFEYSLQFFGLCYSDSSPQFAFATRTITTYHFSFYYLLQWHHLQLLMQMLVVTHLDLMHFVLLKWWQVTIVAATWWTTWQQNDIAMLVRRIFWIKRYCWKPWKNN